MTLHEPQTCERPFADTVLEQLGMPRRARRTIRYGMGAAGVLLCVVTLFASGISVGAWLTYERVRGDSQAEIERLQTALTAALHLAGLRVQDGAADVDEAAEATAAAAATVEQAADGAEAAASAARQAAAKAGAAAAKANSAAAKARRTNPAPPATPAAQPTPINPPAAPPPKPWDSTIHKG